MGNELRRRALLPFSSPRLVSRPVQTSIYDLLRVCINFYKLSDYWCLAKNTKAAFNCNQINRSPPQTPPSSFPSSSPFPLDCNEKAAYKSFNGRSTLALSMGTRTCWLYIGQSGTRLAWTRPPHANDMQKAFIESSHFAWNQRFAFIIRVQNETRIRFRSLWTDDRLAVVSYPENNQ